MPLSTDEMVLVRDCSKDDSSYQRLRELLAEREERGEQQVRQLVAQYESLAVILRDSQNMMMTRISHEFRTPLTIVMTSCDLLERYFDRLDADKRHHHLHKIRMQVHRIAGMLDDILAMMRGMVRHSYPQSKEFALDELCQDIQHRVTMTSGIHHHCYFNITGTPRLITADENLLHTVMMALLSNALKYSPEQSVILFNLHFEALGQGITLRVQNTGIGISETEMPHIFETFYRGENTSATSGLGLGLSITKQIVTLYNGTIKVDSQPNGMTTFTIWLPL